MSGHADAIRAAVEMERARPCEAIPWELREGWGVAIVERTRRGQRRWAGPVEQGWEWLRRASPAPQAPVAGDLRASPAAGQAPAGEASPASSPAGHDERNQ